MTERTDVLLHATAVALALDADGPLAGALLLGPSGAGKSSLALAAIASCPFARTTLIADDQVVIRAGGIASAPETLRGLIEIRGFGPARVKSVSAVRLAAAFELADIAERVPAPRRRQIAEGLALPFFPFSLTGAEATAAHRLRLIVRQVLCGQIGEETQDTKP